jgi:hypothetical protein
MQSTQTKHIHKSSHAKHVKNYFFVCVVLFADALRVDFGSLCTVCFCGLWSLHVFCFVFCVLCFSLGVITYALPCGGACQPSHGKAVRPANNILCMHEYTPLRLCVPKTKETWHNTANFSSKSLHKKRAQHNIMPQNLRHNPQSTLTNHNKNHTTQPIKAHKLHTHKHTFKYATHTMHTRNFLSIMRESTLNEPAR